ncbi:DUF2586 family protein [Brumimicrobium mesophilum]|uniref:DUF2586 family protein n=1 Tax=Brumimicrobium mesophilum TaxID=392717 RepID=UPI000D142C40|nr:DUF2586 family protein [Brumimicrobium mesophilum]
MPLPGIDISFQNGNLGSVVPSPDGLLGLVCHAEAVASTLANTTPYLVTSMKDVAALGIIDDVDNHIVYKFLSEFYAEGGSGTPLWIYTIARDESLSDQFKPDGTTGIVPASTLLDTANGDIRGLIALFNPDGTYVSDVDEEMESEVIELAALAQTFAEDYTDDKYAPFFVLTEGYGYTGTQATLTDLTEKEYNRVGILLGDTESRTGTTASKGAALGVLAGRVAKNAVQVNIGKVRDGALNPLEMFIVDDLVEVANIEALNDKGYITFRKHVSRSGYYFTDSPLATLPSDDYRFLERRRVIDKAYRVAYSSLLDYVLEDLNVNADGSISPIDAKTIEGVVQNAIFTEMTANGELSTDATNPNDLGVIVKVDLTHNITSTSKIKLESLQVAPKAYARYIDVPLGYIPVSI